MSHHEKVTMAFNILHAMRQGYECWAELIAHRWQYFCGTGH